MLVSGFIVSLFIAPHAGYDIHVYVKCHADGKYSGSTFVCHSSGCFFVVFFPHTDGILSFDYTYVLIRGVHMD